MGTDNYCPPTKSLFAKCVAISAITSRERRYHRDHRALRLQALAWHARLVASTSLGWGLSLFDYFLNHDKVGRLEVIANEPTHDLGISRWHWERRVHAVKILVAQSLGNLGLVETSEIRMDGLDITSVATVQ